MLDNAAPASQCHTRTGGRLDARSSVGEVPAAAAASLPALPEIVEPPFGQAPIPAMETSGQCPQNPTSARPPRLYPPLPVSPAGEGGESTGVIQKLRSAKEQGKEPHYRRPSESCSSLRVRTRVGTAIRPL